MSKALSLLAVLALSTPCSAVDLLGQKEEPIQDLIGKIVDALGQSRREPRNNVTAIQAAQVLNDAIADKGEIVKQIAVFASGPGEGRPMVALVVLDLLNYPPSIVIRTLAPHLDSDDKKVRSFVRDWFQSHDSCGDGGSLLQSLNYGDYVDYVRRQFNVKQPVPAAFVDYLFERSPGRALFVFNIADRYGEVVDTLKAMRRELDKREEDSGHRELPPLPPSKEGLGRREIILSEHIISNSIWLHKNKFDEQFRAALPEATAELSKLAKHKQWWARRYVVEVMRRHREFRSQELLDTLRNDADESVSKIARSIKE